MYSEEVVFKRIQCHLLLAYPRLISFHSLQSVQISPTDFENDCLIGLALATATSKATMAITFIFLCVSPECNASIIQLYNRNMAILSQNDCFMN